MSSRSSASTPAKKCPADGVCGPPRQRAGGRPQSQPSATSGQRILQKTDTRKLDIVVLSVRQRDAGRLGRTHARLEGQTFLRRRNEGLHASGDACREGRQACGTDGGPRFRPLRERWCRPRARLQSSRIVMGLSPKLTASEQGAQVGKLLGADSPEPRPSIVARNRAGESEGHGVLQSRTAPAAACGRKTSNWRTSLWLEA